MSILLLQRKSRLASFIEAGLRAEGFQTVRTDASRSTDGTLGRGRHDLIVIDADSIPEGSPRICNVLRRSGVDIPIMILSKNDEPDNIVSSLRSGADDYLSIPFSFDVFLARAEALMRRTAPPQHVADETKVGDLVVDKMRRDVRRGDRRIELTPREYRLLEYLMSSPGQVFSRTRIHERVWGYDKDPLTNVVEVYIRRLRTKIDFEFAPKLIHTVRGFGYKIEATYN